ncbi:Sodium/calcium exchanger family protein [Thalictrum thalictroides]|uniref:Sodium/calcium exchanger family protein n=1 Tax=Thalictrum thalictroides TaxID=46969 RepID=A0A7J6V8T5_THATH|nr:Sodium/calcium exchanger family protein [Thalictrum thalictroides]
MSDVIHDVFQTQSILSFKQSVPETCEGTYGFLPCTNTVLGNLFLIFGYGYFMFLAARYLSTGSELLLEILGPGLVGGLFLPIISVLPEALLILDELYSKF